MKELLLKHGIIPQTLSEENLKNFERYLSSAKSGQLEGFFGFEAKVKAKYASEQEKSADINQKLTDEIKRMIATLERNLPPPSSSVFSAFAPPADDGEFSMKTDRLILDISTSLAALEDIKILCASVSDAPSYEDTIEFTLRRIALCEYSQNSEKTRYDTLCPLFDPCKDKLCQYAGYAELLESTIKQLCESLSAIAESKQGYGAFDRTLRNCINSVHNISISIQQL